MFFQHSPSDGEVSVGNAVQPELHWKYAPYGEASPCTMTEWKRQVTALPEPQIGQKIPFRELNICTCGATMSDKPSEPKGLSLTDCGQGCLCFSNIS